MVKSVGYIRVSTDKQDFERQRDEIAAYAKRNDFLITKFFEDKHTGSDYKDRQGFQELLRYLDDHPDTRVIIFDEISRMGRDTAEQVVTYKQLSQKGIRIYTRGKGEFGKNKEDNLLFTVLSAIAEYEKQTIIDRTSSGKRRVVREGATQISNKPYGYNLILTERKDRVVSKRQFVEINHEEADVVRAIFRIVDEGGATWDIIRYLKRNTICTPDGNETWGRSTILRILHNPMYYGKWQFGKYYRNHKTKYSLSRRNESDLIVVNVPPIIPQDMFERVQIRLKTSREKFNPKNLKDIYILKGIGICACRRMIQCYRDLKSQKRLYRCPQRNFKGISKKTCLIRSLNADFVEKILLTELKKKVGNSEFFKEIKLKELEIKQSRTASIKTRMEKLAKEIEEGKSIAKKYYEKSAKFEIENEQKWRILEDMADSKLKEIEDKTKELDELESEIEKIGKDALNIDVLENIQNALKLIGTKEVEEISKGSQNTRRDFFRKYVKAVKFTVIKEETVILRKTLEKLRDRKIFSKKNKNIKRLYLTCFTKDHRLKHRAIQVINCQVEFVNNITVDIKFPYFHADPEMTVGYMAEGKMVIGTENDKNN